MLADLHYSLRNFRKSPGFVAVAVMVLALGIGANTAIFSVVNAALLHALAFPDSARLVMLWEKNPQMGEFLAERMPPCLKNFFAWKDQSKSFEAMGVYRPANFNLTGGAKPEQIAGAKTSADLPDVLGVHPAIGRMYTGEECQPGHDRVAVISHALFEKRFGVNGQPLGATLRLDGDDYKIIGVWPADFHMPAMWGGMSQEKPGVWTPLDMRSDQPEAQWTNRNNFVYGRLKPGVRLQQASAEMTVIGKQQEQAFPEINKGFNVNVFPLSIEDVGPEMRSYVLLLQGAVGFVLLIACANVANLMLARAIGRRKELAVRLALGATRWRLMRQMFTESILLSIAAGVLGILLAMWGIQAIGALAPPDSSHLHNLHLDPWTLEFTLAVALITGIIFGLAPAFDAGRRNVNEALTQGGRSGSSGISARYRGALVAGEVALAMMLLVGAGLLIRTVQAMVGADQGFRRDHLLTFVFQLNDEKYSDEKYSGEKYSGEKYSGEKYSGEKYSGEKYSGEKYSGEKYSKPEQAAGFCAELLNRVSALSGVTSASLTSGLPMQNLRVETYSVDGAPAPTVSPATDVRTVDDNYFHTMMIPLVRGRAFTRQDAEDLKAAPVIVINQAMAKTAWPGRDPIGRSLKLNDKSRAVIGVVADVRQLGPASPVSPEVYFPSRSYTAMALVVRTAQDPMALAKPISQQIWAIEKDQPITTIRTMDDSLREWTADKRFVMSLLVAFAGLALLLAAAGIYGVLAYSVSQRTREIGIRMAIGASAGDVLAMVVREGLILAAIGVAIGLAGAFALTRLLQDLIFGVTATDPWTFGGGVAVLGIAALAASLIPARRAASLSPLEALRDE
jgi:putative ABC transport system permease protein